MRDTLARTCVELGSWYTRNMPSGPGCGRLTGWLRRYLRTHQSRAGRRRVKTRHGFRMAVDINDWLGREIYIASEYEPGTTAVMARLLRPGGVMVDVGANAGYFSLLAASVVGARGRVFAFEPTPHVRRLLLENVRLNGFDNVTVREEAVADKRGEASFFVAPSNHTGRSSLLPVIEPGKTIEVRVAPLDELLPQHLPVDVVKIDVEGAECRALDGMRQCLARSHPDLVIEVTDEYLRTAGESGETLCRRLWAQGYRAFLIDHDGVVPFERWHAGLPEQFNALFTHRPQLPAGIKIKPSRPGD